MINPPYPLDEAMRAMTLKSLQILDTAPEERFDRITRLAQRFFDADICLVSLVDSRRQWFKSKQGLEVCQTSRDLSFCGHAILDDDVFVVEDAKSDPRFYDNPLVTGEPHIRFYAGCPIQSPSGHRIGTICVMHKEPKTLSDEGRAMLADLGMMVEDEITLITQATIDDLTQSSNRRGFHNVARHVLALCRRIGTPAELALFDLDGFRQLNDAHGTETGDRMLQAFALLLCRCFRSADIIARLGGDEFCVFFAGSNGGSKFALERLEALAESEKDPVVGKLEWSVGTIKFDPDRHTTIERMLADADEKVYEHRSGKQLA